MTRKKHEGLSELIDEARSLYGNDYILVNEGSEHDPNWTIVHQLPKGSGGIREAHNVMDRWR